MKVSIVDKLSYLKACFQALKPLEQKSWYVNVFAIPIGKEVTDFSKYNHLDIVATNTGLVVVLDSPTGKVAEAIDDYKKGQPLFNMTDMISVDSSWIGSITKPAEKRLGGLLINRVVLYPVVQNKLPYMDAPITEKKIETLFANVMIEKKESKNPEKDILISDYVEAMDRLWFFTGISNLIVMASSYKTVTATPGSKELAAKLIEENKDNLGDPVVVANIMNKLSDLHDKDLEGDPVAARMFDKKALTARKKQHLMYGETNDFVTTLKSQPITSTMAQGIDTSEEIFPRYMNDLRYASYSRGHSTQLSGYSYKILQRSIAGLEVTDKVCNTKRGLMRLIEKPDKLVGRYILKNGKWELVNSTQEAGVYLGKTISVRSPAYCQTENENEICYACLGEMYKGQKNAMNNLAADFSGELMNLFLKRMHTSGFGITKIDDVDLFT